MSDDGNAVTRPRSGRGRRLRWLAATLALVVMAAVFALPALHRRILFPRPTPRDVVPPAGVSWLRIPASDGSIVHALHRPAETGSPTLAYFHGNGEQLADIVDLVAWYGETGVGMLAVEYPGYGRASAESPSEPAFYAAGHAAIDYLQRNLQVPHAQTVLMGYSIGAGTATEMARRGLGARLVLVSPFTSVAAMTRRLMPFLPARLFVRDHFDNAAKAAHITMPTFIAHGDRDLLIPIAMSRSLASLFPHASLLAIHGAGHPDVFLRGGDDLRHRIAAFARGR